MAYSQAQNKANQRYQKKAYDRIYLWIRKGKKGIYGQVAKKRGLSLAGLVTDLLDKAAAEEGLTIPEDTAEDTTEDAEQ